MATNRIRKLGGQYKENEFERLLKQLNGRALLVVAIINSNCEECIKITTFIKHLESGFIDKLSQLVMIYGHSDDPIGSGEGKERENPEPTIENNKGEDKKGGRKKLGDSRLLVWDSLPEGHGYCIFLNEKEVLFYRNDFNHDDFASNIVDNIRRFNSSIKSIAGLIGKRIFMENKRTGIIIETSGTTQNSQIVQLEQKINGYGEKLKIPVYFCKGIAQEMTYVVKGEPKHKLKGFNIDKFIKKIK